MADLLHFPDHHDFDEYFMSPMFLRGFSPQYRHLHLEPLNLDNDFELQVFFYF